MEQTSVQGPIIVRSLPQATNQTQDLHKGLITSPTIHPSSTAKDDRLQYLIEELSFLQAHVRSLADQAADIESKFDFLNHEVATLQKLVQEDSTTSDDLAKFRNRDPTPQDKIELLAIIEQQKQVIESLKKKKKAKKGPEQEKEEEPRNLAVDQQLLDSRATVDTHQIELRTQSKPANFSTFGSLPEEPKPVSAVQTAEKKANKTAR